MKHLIKDNQIILSVMSIPSKFTRDNGEIFWGGYDKRTDLHYDDGWRDEERPAFDHDLERLGSPYLDTAADVVKYPIEDRTDLPTLEALKVQKVKQLDPVLDDFATLISRAKLVSGESPELDTAIATIKARKEQAVTDINAFTDVKLLIKFRIKPEDVQAMKDLLTPFLL